MPKRACVSLFIIMNCNIANGISPYGVSSIILRRLSTHTQLSYILYRLITDLHPFTITLFEKVLFVQDIGDGRCTVRPA